MRAIIPAKPTNKRAKMKNASGPSIIHSPLVEDDIESAIMIKPINIIRPAQNIQSLNFPEIICPNTTNARIYSADFRSVSVRRFFSLFLNFISCSYY